MARTKLSSADRRSVHKVVMLAPAEAKKLESQAKKEGTSASNVLREAFLKHSGHAKRPAARTRSTSRTKAEAAS